MRLALINPKLSAKKNLNEILIESKDIITYKNSLFGYSDYLFGNSTALLILASLTSSLFEIDYILRKGAFLKHDIRFTSGIEGNQQFHVIMRMAGIYGDKIKINIPPKSTDGKYITEKNKGLPVCQRNIQGDMIIIFRIDVPNINDNNKELFEKIKNIKITDKRIEDINDYFGEKNV